MRKSGSEYLNKKKARTQLLETLRNILYTVERRKMSEMTGQRNDRYNLESLVEPPTGSRDFSGVL